MMANTAVVQFTIRRAVAGGNEPFFVSRQTELRGVCSEQSFGTVTDAESSQSRMWKLTVTTHSAVTATALASSSHSRDGG